MKRSPLYIFGSTIILLIYKIIMPYRVVGRENLPPSGRVIICCNHLSMKDPILLTAVSGKRQIHYMSKAELFKNKLLGFFLRALGAFPVNRGKGDTQAINTAAQLLEQEQVLGIFLEGTRSKTGELLQPKSGTAVLAHSGKAPILPVCITGQGRNFPRLFHRVVISCGELITPEELGIAEASAAEYRRASRYVMQKIAELRERDRHLLQ